MRPSRWVRSLVLPSVLVALAAAPARAPERWAVIVGINDYLEFSDEDGGDLLGAVNDARAMMEVLTARHGFRSSGIRLLLDGDATRSAIAHALTEWLPARVRPGDLVVFYFAGHGSLVLDLDGDEPDGLDQTICPVDVMKHSTSNDIVDDELGKWLGALRTSRVVVILDSCHSGTATRASGMRQRSLPRPPPAARTQGRGIGTAAALATRVATATMTGDAAVIEIAAAGRSQAAMDASFINPDGSTYHGGAFTTHLVRRLWQAPAGASYLDLFINTVASVKADRFTQDPQITGPASEPIFALAAAPVFATADPVPVPADSGRQALQVHQVFGAMVSINAGRNRGLAAGTLLRLEEGGLVRVDQVTESAAQGTVMQGLARPFEGATVESMALPAVRLVVDISAVPAALRSALREALPPDPELQFVDVESPADLVLVAEAAGGTLAAGDALLSPIRLLGRDGSLRSRSDGGTPAGTAALLARQIRQELAMARLATLENSADGFVLDVTFAGGRNRLAVGDEVEFRVRSHQDGYLTLLDVSPDGTLTLLYPNPYMSLGRLTAGQVVTVPDASVSFTMSLPAGRGVVRALVTERPLFPDSSAAWVADADGAAFAARIRRQLAEVAAAGRKWGSAMVVYEVHQQ
jgi:hypothetical protein